MYSFINNKPSFLWTADKPLKLGGIPIQQPLADIQREHHFVYFEGIITSKVPLPFHALPREMPPKVVEFFENYYTHINKLVICKINEEVGCGVFAKEFIPAGTVVGVYSGEFMVSTMQDEFLAYALSSTIELGEYAAMCGLQQQLRSLTPFIDAKQFGGIARFFQHLPASVDLIYNVLIAAFHRRDEDLFLRQSQLLFPQFDKKTISVIFNSPLENLIQGLNKWKENFEKVELSRRTDDYTEEKDARAKTGNNPLLAYANIFTDVFIYNGVGVPYFTTLVDIQEGEQLGYCYGLEYWEKTKNNCQYFDKNGLVIYPVPQALFVDPLVIRNKIITLLTGIANSRGCASQIWKFSEPRNVFFYTADKDSGLTLSEFFKQNSNISFKLNKLKDPSPDYCLQIVNNQALFDSLSALV